MLLLALTAFAFYRRNEEQVKWKQFEDAWSEKTSSVQGLEEKTASVQGFKPLVYELDAETAYKLEESERRARSSGSKGVDSLARHIDQVQLALAEKRDMRIQGWKEVCEDWKEHGKKQCHEVIKEGGASSDVYEAVFRTIAGPDSEEMRQYKCAAETLLKRLMENKIAQQESGGRVVWPRCKQHTTDLPKLYVEAVLVQERARTVMSNLHKGSADGWRLKIGPLKKMRCTDACMPPRHLSTFHRCPLCATAAGPARRSCSSPQLNVQDVRAAAVASGRSPQEKSAGDLSRTSLQHRRNLK